MPLEKWNDLGEDILPIFQKGGDIGLEFRAKNSEEYDVRPKSVWLARGAILRVTRRAFPRSRFTRTFFGIPAVREHSRVRGVCKCHEAGEESRYHHLELPPVSS